MKQLPENFCIKRNPDNPLWDKYVAWLNKEYVRDLAGDSTVFPYYGVGGGRVDVWNFLPEGFTLLTLEQWDAIVNPKPKFKVGDWITIERNDNQNLMGHVGKTARIIDPTPYTKPTHFNIDIVHNDLVHHGFNVRETNLRHATPEEIDAAFVLPEKWCILRTTENYLEVNKWFNKNSQTGGQFTDRGIFHRLACNYLHYPAHDQGTGVFKRHAKDNVASGYILITFKQFKKHVLKENTMDKKIIGYKWKEGFQEKYEKAAARITNMGDSIGNTYSDGTLFQAKSLCHKDLQRVGVLDLWFDPVYEENKDKTFNIHSDSGTFQLIARKEGLYFKPENKFLDPKVLQDFIGEQQITHNGYTFKRRTKKADLGCKRNCNVDNLWTIINYWNANFKK